MTVICTHWKYKPGLAMQSLFSELASMCELVTQIHELGGLQIIVTTVVLLSLCLCDHAQTHCDP